MKLGKIIEDELLSRELRTLDIASLMEETEHVGRVLSWCIRRGTPEICRRYLEISRSAGEHLARIRIVKALESGSGVEGSIDSNILKAILRASKSMFSYLNGRPIDPFGKIPVKALGSIERGRLKLKKNHYYMLPLDEAILLEMAGVVEILSLDI